MFKTIEGKFFTSFPQESGQYYFNLHSYQLGVFRIITFSKNEEYEAVYDITYISKKLELGV